MNISGTEGSYNSSLDFTIPGPRRGDATFVILNTIILFSIVPGCGLFYSGLTHPGSSLTMLLTSMWSIAIVSVQWWICGYSLAFSKHGNFFIGDLSNAFLMGVHDGKYPVAREIPEIVFSFYQCVTAMLPPSIILGAIADRGRILPAIIFTCIWTTLGYDFLCCWLLNPKGWLFRLGVLDYGGAGPVHVPASAAALAYSAILGPMALPTNFKKPRSMPHIYLGTILIWWGSYGNNAGAGMSANVATILTAETVTLAAASGGLTWMLIEFWKNRQSSGVGCCYGAVSSLVAITSCAGFVSPTSSIVLGIISSTVSNMAGAVKEKYNLNDVLEVAALHGSSGVAGTLLAGILSEKAYGGELMEAGVGGWLDGNWTQIFIQLAALIVTFCWSYGISYAVLFVMNKTSCLRLRVDPEIEIQGIDELEMGCEMSDAIGRTHTKQSTCRKIAWNETSNRVLPI